VQEGWHPEAESLHPEGMSMQWAIQNSDLRLVGLVYGIYQGYLTQRGICVNVFRGSSAGSYFYYFLPL